MKNKDNLISVNSLHYFNAHTRSAEDIVNTFIARRSVLKELEDGVLSEPKNSIPQHYMIIGSRGMGKSTLLRRLEISIRSERFRDKFVPILFPEEQYNIDRLSKFWLNSLDALADSLEIEQKHDEADQIDAIIRDMDSVSNEERLTEMAYDALMEICKKMGRRAVFLLDNIDILFEGISPDEQFKLRKVITENGAPIFIAASTNNPAESQDYDAAFYDAFDNIYLERLSQIEMRELLLYLAERTGEDKSFEAIYEKTGQLDALHNLTGGNPRIAVFMFHLIANGLSDKIFENLNALLDVITPLYKANFEQLSKQAQVIVDALALNWDPSDLDTLSRATRLENNQLSSQLERLIKQGWVERGNRFSVEKNKMLGKVKNYAVRERFFNIWYIMRRASRRQRGDLKSLTCFLETFYTPQHLDIEKQRIIQLLRENLDSDRITYALALSKAFNKGKYNQMEEEIYREVLSKTKGDLGEISKYLDPDIIPHEVLADFMSGNTDLLFDYIQILMEKGEYHKLEKLLLCMIDMEKFSDSAYLNVKLGQVYKELDNISQAEKHYAIALDIDPEDAWAHSHMARLKEELGKLDEAETNYVKAAGLSDDPFYPWLLAEFYLKNGKEEKGEEILKEVVELHPKYVHAINSLAFYYMSGTKLDKAIDMLQRVVDLGDAPADAYYFLGRCQWSEKSGDALDNFAAAVQLAPDAANYWFYLGLCQREKGQVEQAQISYEKAIELEPDNVDYVAGYGRFLAACKEDFQKAAKVFYRAIEIKPSAKLYLQLAASVSVLARHEEAVWAFKKAISLKKDYAEAYAGLAMHQEIFLKQIDPALKNYRKALKLDPEQDEVWYFYGNLLQYKIGDFKEARLAYEKSISIAEPDIDVIDDYVILLRDRIGLREEAFAIFEQHQQLFSRDGFSRGLQQALFALYDHNLGDAKKHWMTALKFEGEISEGRLEALWRAAATASQLGFTDTLALVFEESGKDRELRPVYEAIKALIAGSTDYFLNIAPEVADTAMQLYVQMKNYQEMGGH